MKKYKDFRKKNEVSKLNNEEGGSSSLAPKRVTPIGQVKANKAANKQQRINNLTAKIEYLRKTTINGNSSKRGPMLQDLQNKLNIARRS